VSEPSESQHTPGSSPFAAIAYRKVFPQVRAADPVVGGRATLRLVPAGQRVCPA
jgi:hypothetical protein